MPSKNLTSIVLAQKVQSIKNELAPIFGLKNLVSAGLYLFSKLPSEEQKRTITEIKTPIQKSKKKALTETIENIKMLHTDLEKSGITADVLNKIEQDMETLLKSLPKKKKV